MSTLPLNPVNAQLRAASAADPSISFPRFRTSGLVTPAMPQARPAATPPRQPDIRHALAVVDAFLAEEDRRIEDERNRPPPLSPAEQLRRLGGAVLRAWRGLNEFVDAVSDNRVREDMRESARQCEATRPELAASLRRLADKTWIID